jgi:protein involved in polysaccharide export with SLBB domain
MRPIALIAGLLAVSVGCRGTVAPAPAPIDLQAIEEEIAKRRHFIGPGDVVSIQVYQEKDLSHEQVVAEDGTISLPMVGEIDVRQLTRSELEAALRSRLVKSGIKEPKVAVLIRKMVSAKIAVYGEVRKPGTFTYEAGMTVVHAITLASGFVKTAQQDRVMVIHQSGERLEVPVRQIGLGRVPNVPLLPGDVIYVPESYF